MKANIFTNLKLYSKLLKNPTIKKLLEGYEEYTLTEVNETSLVLTRQTKFKYEYVQIIFDKFKTVNHTICEQRPNGIIITNLEQLFGETAYSNGKSILVYLFEKRSVFTNQKLTKLFKNIAIFSIKDLNDKISTISLPLNADLHTCFIASMEHITRNRFGNLVQSAIIPTRTYLNSEDVSYLYDDVNGNDKLYRIYDLYNGIVNNRNKKDIEAMELGQLPKEGFNLKALKGITAKEEQLVGPSINPIEVKSSDDIDKQLNLHN